MFELRKTGIVRRASAWLLDIILCVVLATGFMFLISLICDYSGEEKLATAYFAEWDEFRKEYAGGVAAHYGYVYKTEEDGSYELTYGGNPATFGDLMQKLYDSKGEDEAMKAAYDAYLALPPASKVNAQYSYVYNLLFMMTSIGLLLSYIVLEFVVPICFKNGQTVGKKVFAICLIRPNGVKITNMALFTRTILGKYAIETMFPILLVFLFLFGGLGILAIVLFAAFELLNIILFFALKNRTPIHDLLAGTVAADMRLQMIFASDEELAEKKAQAEREKQEQSTRTP